MYFYKFFARSRNSSINSVVTQRVYSNHSCRLSILNLERYQTELSDLATPSEKMVHPYNTSSLQWSNFFQTKYHKKYSVSTAAAPAIKSEPHNNKKNNLPDIPLARLTNAKEVREEEVDLLQIRRRPFVCLFSKESSA